MNISQNDESPTSVKDSGGSVGLSAHGGYPRRWRRFLDLARLIDPLASSTCCPPQDTNMHNPPKTLHIPAVPQTVTTLLPEVAAYRTST